MQKLKKIKKQNKVKYESDGASWETSEKLTPSLREKIARFLSGDSRPQSKNRKMKVEPEDL